LKGVVSFDHESLVFLHCFITAGKFWRCLNSCIHSGTDERVSNNATSSAAAVGGRLPGLRYDVVQRPMGPSEAERKLDELTRQLELELNEPRPTTKKASISPVVQPSVNYNSSTEKTPAVSSQPNVFGLSIKLYTVKENDSVKYYYGFDV
jgi:hypothetical protein